MQCCVCQVPKQKYCLNRLARNKTVCFESQRQLNTILNFPPISLRKRLSRKAFLLLFRLRKLVWIDSQVARFTQADCAIVRHIADVCVFLLARASKEIGEL